MLFQGKERSRTGGARPGEGAYAYLDASGRPEAARVRHLLNKALECYPAGHREALTSRLRSDIESVHAAAIFELLIHHGLLIGGCVIEEIEPSLPDTVSRPDFLVRTQAGERFLLEATLTYGLTPQEVGAEKRYDDLLRTLDQIESPDFFLNVTPVGRPTAPIPLRRLRVELLAWLRSLDYDSVKATCHEGVESIENLTKVYGDFTLNLTLTPRNERGPGKRTLGYIMGEGYTRTMGVGLKTSIEGKARRYGHPNLPLVIAVNGLNEHGSQDDFLAALIGTEAVNVFLGSDRKPEWTRNRDGVWVGPRRPRNQRVAVVLGVEGLNAWNVASRRFMLFHNPYGRREAPSIPLLCDEWAVDGENYRRTEGSRFGELLSLPDGWPGD